MACPPGGCASWAASRLCKPLPPICLGCDYDPGELQMIWFCWRARATGEYGGLTPVDLAPGIIDISGKTNIDKIIEYCNSRGPLVAPFTQFTRFGFRLAGILGTPFISFGTTPFVGEADIVAPPPPAAGGGGLALALSCDEDPCKMACVVGQRRELIFTASNGVTPYTWSFNNPSVCAPDIALSGVGDSIATVTPPSTAGTGIAYIRQNFQLTGSGCPTNQVRAHANFECDDTVADACVDDGNTTPGCDTTGTALCSGPFCSPGDSGLPFCGDPGEPPCNDPTVLLSDGIGNFCDTRTQTQIDAGCCPCSVVFDGRVITVEDSVGAQVSIVITI